MSVINGKTVAKQQGVLQTTWTPLGAADTGTPEELSRYPDKSVQIDGTFGGATAVLEGSDDGVTYFTVKDVYGTAVSSAVAARFDIRDVAYFLRPRTSGGGGGSAVAVTLTSRSNHG